MKIKSNNSMPHITYQKLKLRAFIWKRLEHVKVLLEGFVEQNKWMIVRCEEVKGQRKMESALKLGVELA